MQPWKPTGVGVLVRVAVLVGVCVLVGVLVLLGVGVFVGVFVSVGVLVGVEVFVSVAVGVGQGGGVIRRQSPGSSSSPPAPRYKTASIKSWLALLGSVIKARWRI